MKSHVFLELADVQDSKQLETRDRRQGLLKGDMYTSGKPGQGEVPQCK